MGSKHALAVAPSFAPERARVEAWLRRAPIQPIDNKGHGGIAGVLDPTGKPAFLYGEITGYWLRWASLYQPDRARMEAAVAFLAEAWAGTQAPPTRVGACGDWRNGAIFSFDLAMMLQGLADAAPIVGDARCAEVAARLVGWLDRMVGTDGLFVSHIMLDPVAPPDRWSTRAGPYQAKTAAAILSAPAAWLPPNIRSAAASTFAAWQGRAADHPELHPRFYALEGSLREGGRPDPTLIGESALAALSLEQIDCAESPARADVLAQALRLLCIFPEIAPGLVDPLASALMDHIRSDGSVMFRRGDDSANVWCAMFAHQALDWLCAYNGEGSRGVCEINAII